MKDHILSLFAESATIKQQFARDHADRIAQVAKLMAGAFRDGRKVLLFGNGGSATDAAHIAAEFVGRYKRERAPFRTGRPFFSCKGRQEIMRNCSASATWSA